MAEWPKIDEDIGPYTIVSPLGGDGHVRVYLAEHNAMADAEGRLRQVALAVLSPDAENDADARRRFFNEAKAFAKLKHENLIDVVDILDAPPHRAFTVGLMRGRTMADALKATGGKLPLGRAMHLAWQIASALHAAHDKGLYHLALAPSLVFLVDTGDGRDAVKVLGFDSSQRNPAYLAPEMHKAGGDQRADIYAFGVVLYELTAGRLPFLATTPEALRTAHEAAPPRKPSSLAAMPAQLETLILKCLAKDPDARPDTMDDVLAALREIAGLVTPWQPDAASPVASPGVAAPGVASWSVLGGAPSPSPSSSAGMSPGPAPITGVTLAPPSLAPSSFTAQPTKPFPSIPASPAPAPVPAASSPSLAGAPSTTIPGETLAPPAPAPQSPTGWSVSSSLLPTKADDAEPLDEVEPEPDFSFGPADQAPADGAILPPPVPAASATAAWDDVVPPRRTTGGFPGLPQTVAGPLASPSQPAGPVVDAASVLGMPSGPQVLLGAPGAAPVDADLALALDSLLTPGVPAAPAPAPAASTPPVPAASTSPPAPVVPTSPPAPVLSTSPPAPVPLSTEPSVRPAMNGGPRAFGVAGGEPSGPNRRAPVSEPPAPAVPVTPEPAVVDMAPSPDDSVVGAPLPAVEIARASEARPASWATPGVAAQNDDDLERPRSKTPILAAVAGVAVLAVVLVIAFGGKKDDDKPADPGAIATAPDPVPVPVPAADPNALAAAVDAGPAIDTASDAGAALAEAAADAGAAATDGSDPVEPSPDDDTAPSAETMVTVAFDSSPQGGEVYVDGEAVGLTPVELPYSPSKKLRKVVFKLEGFYTATKSAVFKEGTKVSTTFVPMKKTATKPVASATKPAATKPAATKPAATKPAATKPAATNKPADLKGGGLVNPFKKK